MALKINKKDFWERQLDKRRGRWMQTYTGKQYFPLAPHPDDVDIEDIAHSLSLQCRFNGHCEKYYSVAEHSRRCVDAISMMWPDIFNEVFSSLPEDQDKAFEVLFDEYMLPLKKMALLHDAAEAYMCDLPRPFKKSINNYKKYEELNMAAIITHFDIWPKHPVITKKYVKIVDNVMLMTEKRDLMKEAPALWEMEGIVEPLDNPIYFPQNCKDAEKTFMMYYDCLFNGEGN